MAPIEYCLFLAMLKFSPDDLKMSRVIRLQYRDKLFLTHAYQEKKDARTKEWII